MNNVYAALSGLYGESVIFISIGLRPMLICFALSELMTRKCSFMLLFKSTRDARGTQLFFRNRDAALKGRHVISQDDNLEL